MANELDELYALTASPEDKAALQAIMDRNPNLKTRAETAATVYNAFVGGDDSAIDKAAREAKERAAASSPSNKTPLALDMDELIKLTDTRAEARFKAITTSPEYVEQQKKMIEDVAEAVGKKLAPQILSAAAKSSDEIYQVRASHSREFNSELDTTKFTEFLNANPGKFADLSKAHDAFVHDDRIKNEIARGVAEEVKKREAAAPPVEVPGTSLPSAESPLGAMIRANKLTVGETQRGPAIDAAVKHFRQLQSARGAAAN